jgi:hypothetical protein
MPERPAKNRPGCCGDPVSLHPLTMDQAADAIFQIKPAGARVFLASKSGKKK